MGTARCRKAKKENARMFLAALEEDKSEAAWIDRKMCRPGIFGGEGKFLKNSL